MLVLFSVISIKNGTKSEYWRTLGRSVRRNLKMFQYSAGFFWLHNKKRALKIKNMKQY